jgi:hypothetical protein
MFLRLYCYEGLATGERSQNGYNNIVLVTVSVNSMNSGRIQICVSKPQANPSPVQTYSTPTEARNVLQAFGIEEREIEETLKLLIEVGPHQALRFSPREISQKTLSDHGFNV